MDTNLIKSARIVLLCAVGFVILWFAFPKFLGIFPTSLTGRWELMEDSRGFDYLEFFSDGYYSSSSSNYEGKFSVDGNRIRLQGDLVESKVYTFKRQGNQLIFLKDDGEIYSIYEKVQN